jgi:hypothetical protein
VPGVGGNLQCSFRGNTLDRLDGDVERLANDGADLARQTRVQDELVIHVEEARHVAELVLPL